MINNYFLLINGEQTGPYTQHEIIDMDVDARTMIFSPISNDWQEMVDLPEFNTFLADKGIYIPTHTNVASFWWRLLAYFLDYIFIIIIAGVASIIYFTIIAYLRQYNPMNREEENILNLFGVVLMICYHSVLEATKLRGGFGKVICKLAVVDINGQRVSLGKAFSRNAAKLLSCLMLGFGFLNILWDKKRQGYHDMLAKTYVVRR